MDPIWIELRCSTCGYRESVPFESLVDQVRKVGHLKKSAEPSRELVLELARTHPPILDCPQCGSQEPARLPGDHSVDDSADDESQWGQSRRCQSCRSEIDPDRLEVFPNTKLCMTCQRKSEAGGSDDYGFCDACGGRLALAGRSGSGLAGYQLRCSDCGRKQ